MSRSRDLVEIDPVMKLDPKEQLAVRYYTDPLLPTFGDESKAALKAGFGNSIPMRRPDVITAIQYIQAERALEAEQTATYMESYALDAARELVRQLSTGAELDMLDPVQFLGLEVGDDGSIMRELLTKEEISQIAALNNHNKNVLAAARERRSAAETLIAYRVGTPEQRVKHTNAIAEKNEHLPDLSEWSKDELQKLAAEVSRLRQEPQTLEAEDDLD